MSMPTIPTYSAAVQNPENLGIPLLRSMCPVCDDQSGAPRFWPGAFGVVFRFESDDGAARAVKCFTQSHKTRSDRYEAVSEYLDIVFSRNLSLSKYLVNSVYMQRGIQVNKKWYPLLLMDWVDGQFLHTHIDGFYQKPNAKESFARLARQWKCLVLALKDAGIAHGDLQHANVLVTHAGELKLIDYDGMCVPALANRYVIEGGHLNYQHPARTIRYDLNLDAFSALVILTALTVLSWNPELWPTYFRGNNLLFLESDFKCPESSPLFNELQTIREPAAAYLTNELRALCKTGDATRLKPIGEILCALPDHDADISGH